MTRALDASIIIPTRGRPQSLQRTLDALERQQTAGRTFEVVVVIDGDDSVGQASRLPVGQASRLPVGPLSRLPPFPLRTIALSDQRGAAAARNAGAAVARAPLLIFLDDDIEASPGLVAAHLSAHGRRDELAPRAVIGYLSTRVRGQGFFPIALRGWWEAMFEAMRRPGHRFGYRDVLTGNLSVAADTFHRVGGFDEALRCHEDFEFGARLVEAGVELRLSDLAHGTHDERTDLDRALARKRAEGAADVQILRRHPRLLPTLPLGWLSVHASRRQRWLRALAFQRPGVARAVARRIQSALAVLEWGRLRGRWFRVLDDLLAVHYWFGVQEVLPRPEQVSELAAWCAASATPRGGDVVPLDLSLGAWPEIQRVVDARRPAALRLSWQGAQVGELGEVPGAERLRAVHLQRALTEELALPLLRVLDASGVIQVNVAEAGAVATRVVPRRSLASARPS